MPRKPSQRKIQALQDWWNNPINREKMTRQRNGQYNAIVDAGERECIRCHIPKPLSEFPSGRKRRDGRARYAYCRKCHADYQRAQKLKNFFLISVEEADIIFSYQNHLCAICGRIPANGKRLALDHRHSDGLIRGGLCNWCNRAIARFRDDISRLRAAADYLENPPATRALGSPHFARPGRVGTQKQRADLRREKKAAQKLLDITQGKV